MTRGTGEPYDDGMPPDIPAEPATPEEALAWTRRMMVLFPAERARDMGQLLLDHEEIIMGGWNRRERKYFPGLLVTIANIARNQTIAFVILGAVVLGTSAPSWWPLLKAVMFP